MTAWTLNFLASSYMIYLFFGKKKSFPKWFIWTHVATLVYMVADCFALQVVRPDLPLFDAESNREIGKLIVSMCVWVPYMIVSKRVQSTFTR